jgi:hypothetical protein
VIRGPFPGNIIPQDRIDNPMYKFYADRMPLPNNDPTDPTREPLNNYLATAMPNTVDYRSWNNRFDYQLSDKHRFFFRWLKSDFLEGAQDYTYETEFGLMNWDEKRPAYTAAADWTYAINPTTIFNVTADTNWFLVQNQRLGTRKLQAERCRTPSLHGCEMRRLLCSAPRGFPRHDSMVRRHGHGRPGRPGSEGPAAGSQE